MARKILLADDSVTAQNMGRKILADAGYEVTTVNNGSAALKKIAECRPDLIVLDVYMPGYSGLEVCQRLKETGDTARIPVLLTVGKLEPFKPEEAKRVRAEGFIVKPFEASELLSALTKLEDKIVPRSDSSKPGRFARAIAAVEEGRYDKTVSIDEDSGWKNRISFPSKKKEKKPEPEDANDPAIYNAVNKDLRTTVEHPAAPSGAMSEEQVNVGALAPKGLPKDVTPEEIAALAAAAAQIAGISEEKSSDSAPPSPQPEPAVATPAAQDSAPASTIDVKCEAESAPAPEVKAEEPPSITENAPSEAHEAAATFAASKVEEESTSEATAVTSGPSIPEPGHRSEPEPVHAAAPEPVHIPEPEPVTIAASSEVLSPQSSRWTVVAVALAPEETGISIEDEMRRAYADFVGAQASAKSEVSPAVETQSEPASSSFDRATLASDTAMPQMAPMLSAAAAAAHESVSAAVKQFEAVATRPAEIAEPPMVTTAVAEPAATEPMASSGLETPAANLETHQEECVPSVQETISAPLPRAEGTSVIEATNSQREPEQVIAAEISIPAEALEQAAVSQVFPEPQPTAPESRANEASNSGPEPSGASWRRIRESAPESPQSVADAPRDEAAMAVAAGAEKTPQEVTVDSEEAPEIASIVDSVLADLRPKIVAEISKKLGKKK